MRSGLLEARKARSMVAVGSKLSVDNCRKQQLGVYFVTCLTVLPPPSSSLECRPARCVGLTTSTATRSIQQDSSITLDNARSTICGEPCWWEIRRNALRVRSSCLRCRKSARSGKPSLLLSCIHPLTTATHSMYNRTWATGSLSSSCKCLLAPYREVSTLTSDFQLHRTFGV